MWYGGYPPFKLLEQKTYVGHDSTYDSSAKDPISFDDANGKLAMLVEMLSENVRQDWKVPWTTDATVGQKIVIRVLVGDDTFFMAKTSEVHVPLDPD